MDIKVRSKRADQTQGTKRSEITDTAGKVRKAKIAWYTHILGRNRREMVAGIIE